LRRLLSRGIPSLISAYASIVPNNGAKRIRESNEQPLRFKHQQQERSPADRPPRSHSDDYGALHHRRFDALPPLFDSLRGAHADYGSPPLHDAHFTSYYDVHPPLCDSFGHGNGAPSHHDALQHQHLRMQQPLQQMHHLYMHKQHQQPQPFYMQPFQYRQQIPAEYPVHSYRNPPKQQQHQQQLNIQQHHQYQQLYPPMQLQPQHQHQYYQQQQMFLQQMHAPDHQQLLHPQPHLRQWPQP
jgi:hypothetical protein